MMQHQDITSTTVSTSTRSSSLETVCFEDTELCALCLEPLIDDIDFCTPLDNQSNSATFFTKNSYFVVRCENCKKIFHLHCVINIDSLTTLIDWIETLPFHCTNC